MVPSAADPAELRPHDLLWIDGIDALECDEPVPEWVRASLREMPVAVVRRARRHDGSIPVGVRGRARNQRFAASVPRRSVTRRVSPEQLVAERRAPDAIRAAAIPALRAFQDLLSVLAEFRLLWGPTGSVGFELATGVPAATPASDIDLVLRAPAALARAEARDIMAMLSGIGPLADIQMETPVGCVALREYCASAAGRPVLLRTAEGPALVTHPWRHNGGE